jgi:hypothetical protein
MDVTKIVSETLRATGVTEQTPHVSVTVRLVDSEMTSVEIALYAHDWRRILVEKAAGRSFSPARLLRDLHTATGEILHELEERGLVPELT